MIHVPGPLLPSLRPCLATQLLYFFYTCGSRINRRRPPLRLLSLSLPLRDVIIYALRGTRHSIIFSSIFARSPPTLYVPHMRGRKGETRLCPRQGNSGQDEQPVSLGAHADVTATKHVLIICKRRSTRAFPRHLMVVVATSPILSRHVKSLKVLFINSRMLPHVGVVQKLKRPLEKLQKSNFLNLRTSFLRVNFCILPRDVFFTHAEVVQILRYLEKNRVMIFYFV